MKNWLEKYTKAKYGKDYEIEVIIPQSNLNILSNSKLSIIPNVGLMEFKPDVLAILVDRNDSNNVELIFLNRELKKFGLREIGEMLCYCRIAKPKLTIMASLQGLSPAVDRMINHSKKNQLISYDGNHIVIFRWDEEQYAIDEYSITPIESKSLLS